MAYILVTFFILLNKIEMISKEEVQYKFPIVQIWFDGKYQFNLDNDIELNNIRILALERDCTDKVEFVFKPENKDSIVLSLTDNGDLSNWPLGMYDGIMIQLAGIFRYRKSKDKTELKIVQ